MKNAAQTTKTNSPTPYAERAGAIILDDGSERGALVAEMPTGSKDGRTREARVEALRILVGRANSHASNLARIAELEGALAALATATLSLAEHPHSSIAASIAERAAVSARSLLAKKEG